MKKLTSLIAIAVAAAMLTGMGSLGSKAETGIPIPDENFRAVVTDKLLLSSKAENVSCNGETFFKAYRGKMQVAIPFKKVKKAVFRETEEEGFQEVTVIFWDGGEHVVKMRNIVKCFGQTDLGPMQIKIRDLAKIEFEKVPEQQTDKEQPDEQR